MPPLPPPLRDALRQLPEAEAEGLTRTWALLGGVREPDVPGVPPEAQAWAALEARLGWLTPAASSRAGDRPPAGRRPARRVRAWSLGAAVMVLAVVAGLAWWGRQPVTVQTAAGEQARVDLPDGSAVWLNSDARLTYRRGFGPALGGPRGREVALVGEAFFEVVPDARPFVVETFSARVAVLGTRFNVRARPDEQRPATVVAVESGRVRVQRHGGPEAVLVGAGQRARVALGTAPSAPALTPAAPPWRGGGFAAEDAPLGDILAEIRRRYAVEVVPAPGVPLGLPLTLYYAGPVSAETLVQDVALAAGLRYRPRSRGFDLLPLAP